MARLLPIPIIAPASGANAGVLRDGFGIDTASLVTARPSPRGVRQFGRGVDALGLCGARVAATPGSAAHLERWCITGLLRVAILIIYACR